MNPLWEPIIRFLLTWRSPFGDCGVNIHPLLSLVGDQLPTPCFLTLPEDTPQLTLHVYIDDITTSATLSDTVSPQISASVEPRSGQGLRLIIMARGRLMIKPMISPLFGLRLSLS